MVFKKGLPAKDYTKVYLVNIKNYPTPVTCAWNPPVEKWVYATFELDFYHGVQTDGYFESEWCEDDEIESWLEL